MANLMLTQLAAILSGAGETVVEIAGWQSRARPPETGSFDPSGILWHHTGPGVDGQAGAEWMGEVGRSDLPPPLVQLSVGRDGTWYVIAAGRANHAGEARASGPMPAGDGNTMYLGVEVQNSGTEGYSTAQMGAMLRGGAALTRAYGWLVDANRGHKETSLEGKWDPGLLDMDRFRADLGDTLAGHGDYTIAYSAPLAPPATAPVGADDFASAPAIALGGVTPAMDLSTFTVSPDEPSPPDWTAWWTYTPTTSGLVVFDTFLSPDPTNTDTIIEVFSGTTETDLVRVGVNDGLMTRSDGLSLLMVNLTAGQTYYVRLGCWDDGAPTAAVLRVRPAEWQPWVDREPFAATTVDLTPAAASALLPDGQSSVGIHMAWSSREVTDSYHDGVDRSQDVWDQLRGARDPGSGYLLTRNWADPDPNTEWYLHGSVKGSFADDGLFHPSGMVALERYLHPTFYLSSNSEVLLGADEVAYENEGAPTWDLTVTASVSGSQDPLSGPADTSYEESRAELWRFHDHASVGDEPWTVVPPPATWPADHLVETDTNTLHLNVNGWFLSHLFSVFPESLYHAAVPLGTKQNTYFNARNMVFHVAASVTPSRYRVAKVLEVTDPPPVDPPYAGDIPLPVMAISGSLDFVRRSFTA